MLPSIRLVALCVFRKEGRILVGRGYDAAKDESFFRPLGGEVEFGELAVEAVRREIIEELGLEIADPTLLGVLENRFTYDGKPCHEVVFVFDAQLEKGVYAMPEVPILDPAWEGPAIWLDLSEPHVAPLYPQGLEDFLNGTD